MRWPVHIELFLALYLGEEEDWAITGTIWFFASLIILDSTESNPQEEDYLRLEMILCIWSGWALLSLIVHFRFCISLLSKAKGSPGLDGIFCLSFLTLVTKKLFIILDMSLWFGIEHPIHGPLLVPWCPRSSSPWLLPNLLLCLDHCINKNQAKECSWLHLCLRIKDLVWTKFF